MSSKASVGGDHHADAAALDIPAGRNKDNLRPRSETLPVLHIMDEVRRREGEARAGSVAQLMYTGYEGK